MQTFCIVNLDFGPRRSVGGLLLLFSVIRGEKGAAIAMNNNNNKYLSSSTSLRYCIDGIFVCGCSFKICFRFVRIMSFACNLFFINFVFCIVDLTICMANFN